MRNPCQASELAPDERIVLERILGRPLDDSETISVTTSRVIKEAPVGEAREKAARELAESIREMHERVKDVPEEELYALIDEAVEYVRHNPE